jgi:putative aminopeptidase FrvX
MKNIDLLKELYLIHSPSGKEKKMKSFLKTIHPFTEDKKGNLYFQKGESTSFPCFVAHLDEVNFFAPTHIVKLDNLLFGYDVNIKKPAGIGADDKNGIWTILQLIKILPAIKVALFVEEETGGKGSSKCNVDFFKDCQYIVQIDRKNGSDLVTDITGKICSDSFLKEILPIATKFGYKETFGMFTDVSNLVRLTGLSCINISCGYYNPHTDEECTSIPELQNCLQFCIEIGNQLKDTFPHKHSYPKLVTYDCGDDHYAKYPTIKNHYSYGTYSKRKSISYNSYDNCGFYDACSLCTDFQCSLCTTGKRQSMLEEIQF